MPRPVYILCSESAAVDVDSKLISYFNVLERVEATVVIRPHQLDVPSEVARPSVVSVSSLTFRAIAVWMKLPEDDPQQPYQVQVALRPPVGEERLMRDVTGRFFNSDDRPLHRVGVIFEGNVAAIAGPGLYHIESRLRRVGSDDWMRQDYPFHVVEVAADEEIHDHGADQQNS